MATFFRHYKNRYYQLVGEALDTRDDTLVIVYRTLYPSEYSLFTRPKEEFLARCGVPTAPSASVSPLSNMPSCPKTPAPMLPMR